MGVTVLYSSGDNGVSGNGRLCLNPDGSQSANGKIFNPTFPGGCPYVTSVGATQSKESFPAVGTLVYLLFPFPQSTRVLMSSNLRVRVNRSYIPEEDSRTTSVSQNTRRLLSRAT
jgi:subtilase family serine protease